MGPQKQMQQMFTECFCAHVDGLRNLMRHINEGAIEHHRTVLSLLLRGECSGFFWGHWFKRFLQFSRSGQGQSCWQLHQISPKSSNHQRKHSKLWQRSGKCYELNWIGTSSPSPYHLGYNHCKVLRFIVSEKFGQSRPWNDLFVSCVPCCSMRTSSPTGFIKNMLATVTVCSLFLKESGSVVVAFFPGLTDP